MTCDPAGYPRCDGTLDRHCVGADDAGWFQLTSDCGPGRGCAVSDAGRTFCFDRLDGG